MSLGKSFGRRGALVAIIVFALSLVAVPSAFAAGTVEKLGDVEATVYAPSVVWQSTNAHVIVKLENKGSAAAKVEGSFKVPEGKESQFNYGLDKGKAKAATKDPIVLSKDIAPGKTEYLAFTYFAPKGSAQLGQYTANLTLKAGTASKTIPWAFDVRAGQVFQAETDAIVYSLYAISAGMLVFWFVYFKGFIKKNFKLFAGEQPQ